MQSLHRPRAQHMTPVCAPGIRWVTGICDCTHTHIAVHRRHWPVEARDACRMPLPLGHRMGCGEARLPGGVAGEGLPCGTELPAPLPDLPPDQAG